MRKTYVLIIRVPDAKRIMVCGNRYPTKSAASHARSTLIADSMEDDYISNSSGLPIEVDVAEITEQAAVEVFWNIV